MRDLSVALVMAAILAGAAQEFPFWPGVSCDASVPTLEKVAGHRPGEKITRPADIVRYLEALTAAAPNRIKVFDYGKSWQGRRLIYATIGSEANIRELD